MVVGHSMGFAVATALAAQSSELVDRLVNIDEGPSPSDGDLPFLAKLGYVPVIGQAMWRLDARLSRQGRLRRRVRPGLRPATASRADQVVDDFRAMTYTSFDDSASADTRTTSDAEPLDERAPRRRACRCWSIFGSEDQL